MMEIGLPVNSPDHWQVVCLPETVEIWDKKRVPINKAERDKRIGEIPYYGATGQVGWIDEYLFDDELILLGEDGAPFLEPKKQKAYIIRGKSWVNNHAHVLKARDGVESAFIKHYLDIIDYRNFVSGTTRLKLTQAAMRRIPVPLPCPDEQKQIVDEIETQLARLDDAVAALERARTRLKNYRASVLKAACEGRLVPTEAELARQEGRDYEPASVLLERIKAEQEASAGKKRGKAKKAPALDISELPELPEGWVWTRLDQLAEIVRGASPRPAGDPRYFGGDIPWITVGSLTADDSPYLTSTKDFVTEAGKAKSRFIEADTLLLTNSGATLGVPKITRVSGCINDGSVALTGIDDAVLKLYLYYYLKTQTQKLRAVNQGAAQPNLNTSIVKSIVVPLPPFAEQRQIITEIERRLSSTNHNEMTTTINIKRAEALRQSILRKAFSGRLSTTEQLIEVAR